VQITHPRYGTRVVDEAQVERKLRVGWTRGPEVVPEVVDEAMNTVLASVGDDPVKAREALAAEQSRTAPRKSLVTALVRVIESDTKEN
jgi:hypothetical protein